MPPPPWQKCGHISWEGGGVSGSAHLSEITLQNINSGRDIHGSFSQHWNYTNKILGWHPTSYFISKMSICFGDDPHLLAILLKVYHYHLRLERKEFERCRDWKLSALLSSELRMLALLWGLGFNKFTGNFTKYLPGKISRECWKSYLDILTEIDISVLNRACENFPCKLNLWTLILSVHTFWTQGALTLLKDLVKNQW